MTEHRPSQKIAMADNRAEIENDIRRHPSRVVARLHGINPNTILKHARWLRAQDERRESMSEADRLAESLDTTRRRLEDVLDWVNRTKRNDTAFADDRALKVVRELRSTIESIARIRGITRSGVQVGIQVNNGAPAQPAEQQGGVTLDQLIQIQMTALQDYPEARAALIRAYREHEQGAPMIETTAREVR